MAELVGLSLSEDRFSRYQTYWTVKESDLITRYSNGLINSTESFACQTKGYIGQHTRNGVSWIHESSCCFSDKS